MRLISHGGANRAAKGCLKDNVKVEEMTPTTVTGSGRSKSTTKRGNQAANAKIHQQNHDQVGVELHNSLLSW